METLINPSNQADFAVLDAVQGTKIRKRQRRGELISVSLSIRHQRNRRARDYSDACQCNTAPLR